MSKKPFLFNTPMVQAILVGRKTMTRRLNGLKEINEEPNIWNTCQFGYDSNGHCVEVLFKDIERNLKHIKIPWQVGDILWVRETWKVDSIADHLLNMAIDFKAVQSGYSQAEILCDFTKERYKKFRKFYQKNGWQSPYFMPGEAARLFLRVTNVRVERLQDISERDILAEGTPYDQETYAMPCNIKNAGETYLRGQFMRLWDSLNSKRGYGWYKNPWVWVIEFVRVNDDEIKG